MLRRRYPAMLHGQGCVLLPQQPCLLRRRLLQQWTDVLQREVLPQWGVLRQWQQRQLLPQAGNVLPHQHPCVLQPRQDRLPDQCQECRMLQWRQGMLPRDWH